VSIASRVVRTGTVEPGELIANPRNWRQHPRHQREALRDLLGRVGWVQGVVINERTGLLVDGHLRAELAAEEGAEGMPATWVDLSPEEEALVLASLDPIGDLAAPDAAALDELLGSLGLEDDALDGLLADLRGEHGAEDPLDHGDGPTATESDFWPILRLQVSPETQRRYEELPGDSDDEKLRALLDG
jgi:ParB-like chromosome segregation protein Spo0J